MALIPGNLLPENVQGVETDASGWSGAGGTLSRISGTIVPGSGSFILRLTSSGTADSVLTTVAAVPVTPGTDYRAYGSMAVAGRATNVTVELHWYDGADAEIGTPAVGPVQAVDGTGGTVVAQPFTTGRAPDGAEGARLVLRSTNTAASQQVFWDEMYVGPPPNPAGNLLTYDEYSFEVSDADYEAEGATTSRAQVLLASVNDGAYMLGVAPDAMGLVRVVCPRLVPVTAGDTYSVGALVLTHANGDTNASVSARPRVRYFDAAENFYSDDNPEPFFTQDNGAGNAYSGLRASRTRVVPVGAAFAQVVVEIQHLAPTTATSYLVDQVTLIPSAPEYTLEVFDDQGYIALDVDVIPPGSPDTYSVWRVDESGQQHPVRGYGSDLTNVPYPAESTLSIEDYEAPVGTRVWYRVEWYGADTTVQLTTVTVRAPRIADRREVWVKAPGQPALNLRLMVANAMAWSRESRSATYEVRGRKMPVVVTEVRASRSGELQLYTWDPADTEGFDALLDSGHPLLIQATPGMGISGNLYVAVGSVSQEPIYWQPNQLGALWTLEIREIDRPEGGIEGTQGRTWQDVYDEHQTWQEVYDTYTTYASVLTGV